MPRFARVVVPDFPHHVTQRGNERRDIFFSPSDRRTYLGILKQYAGLYRVDVLGFCLMTNHVHLILVPHQPDALARMMRCAQMRYSQYRHALERNGGHLWQSRYYSCAFEPQRLAAVMRYVELNPVRAGLVQEAALYPWSSAAVHLGAADSWGLLDTTAWRSYWSTDEWWSMLAPAEPDAAAIRDATYSGRPLGSKEFIAWLERHAKRALQRGISGRPRKSRTAAAALI